ncbi:MAG: hypothetical protein MJA82_14915 [Clostridia bacterium]|nr:hypothetical protein [Clostridia bacterium]
MKKFFFGIAFLIFSVQVLLGLVQYYELNHTYNQLKRISELASGAAVLYVDKYAFGTGETIYNHTEGNKAIKEVIKTNLNLNDSMYFIGKSDKFKEKVEYTSYYFDANNKLTVYKDGVFQKQEDISYPYQFKDNIKSYIKTINYPTVCTTIDIGKYNSFNELFSNTIIVRVAAHETLGD